MGTVTINKLASIKKTDVNPKIWSLYWVIISTKSHFLTPALTHYLQFLQCSLVPISNQHNIKKIFQLRMGRFESSLKHIEINCTILSWIFEIAESKIDEVYISWLISDHIWSCEISMNNSCIMYLPNNSSYIF